MSLWKPIDWLGYEIAKWWTPQLQVRTGVVMTLVGIVLLPVGPFSGEPPLIYYMSAFALIVGGMSVLITAVLAIKEDDKASEEDLRPSGTSDENPTDI